MEASALTILETPMHQTWRVSKELSLFDNTDPIPTQKRRQVEV